MKVSGTTSATALVVATMLLAGPARAEGWEIIVTPYFMAPSSDGKFGVGPFDTRISTSPADVFSNLNWGVMGSGEINNGNWGFNLDVNYMNLDITPDDVRRLSVNGHQAAYTATILKRVHEHAWVYGGLRVSDMGLRFECQSNCLPNGGINLPNGGANLANIDPSRNQSWVEILAGFRAELPFNDSLDLTVNADVGGFGVGSEVSVNVWPQLGIRISDSTKAIVGYRVIYVKHESEGDGVRFLYDAVTYGPTLGLEFRF